MTSDFLLFVCPVVRLFATVDSGESQGGIWIDLLCGVKHFAVQSEFLGKVNLTKKAWEKAKALYLSGSDWETISATVGAKVTTLQVRACREGLTKLKKQAVAVSSNKSSQDLETLGRLVRQKLAADALTTLERVEGYLMADVADETKREQVLGSVTKRAATVFGWSEESAPVQVNVALLGALNDREPQPIEV